MSNLQSFVYKVEQEQGPYHVPQTEQFVPRLLERRFYAA